MKINWFWYFFSHKIERKAEKATLVADWTGIVDWSCWFSTGKWRKHNIRISWWMKIPYANNWNKLNWKIHNKFHRPNGKQMNDTGKNGWKKQKRNSNAFWWSAAFRWDFCGDPTYAHTLHGPCIFFLLHVQCIRYCDCIESHHRIPFQMQ